MPWVLATHRDEDVPHSATHALILDEGKIVYSGKIALRAPREVAGPRGRGRPQKTTKTRERRLLKGARQRPPSAGQHPARSPHPTRATDSSHQAKNADVHLDEYKALHEPDLRQVNQRRLLGHPRLQRLRQNHPPTHPLWRPRRRQPRLHRARRHRPRRPAAGVQSRAGFVAAHLQTIHPHHLTVDEIVQSGRHASIGLNDAAHRRRPQSRHEGPRVLWPERFR